MANNMNEGLEAEGSRADHALRIKTPAGTEISTNDKWTARIIVTTAGVAGIVAVGGVTKFCLDQPQVVEKAVEVALKIWGEVSSIKFGSVIIELDCGSEEKLLQFLDDFENGNVKAALEKEFRERGYNSEQDLLVTLDKKALPKAILIRRTMHSITEEKVMVQNLNPFVTAVEKDRKYKPVYPSKPDEEDRDEIERGFPEEEEEMEDMDESSEDEPSASGQDPAVKKGNPENDELEQLANDIDPSYWKKVGRKLKIDDPKITAIDKENEEYSEKKYKLLLHWKQKNGRVATWEELYQALVNVELRELAEKHCCKEMN